MAQPSINRDDPRAWGRPTWAEVDLDRVAGNVRAVRRVVGERCKIMAVVKANGYGHGAEMIAETALESGADSLAVATVDEGIVLRAAGINAPILVLGPISPGEIPRSLRETLSLTISNEAMAKTIAAEAERLGSRPAPVHLKLDSGMRRFGGNLEEVLSAARVVQHTQSLRLAGLFTHFADADAEDPAFTDAQMASLGECVSILADNDIAPDAVHASNSAALLRDPRYHLDMVRLGIALYGLPPSLDFRLPDDIQSVMSVVSTVARTMTLEPGDTVSYGRTYRAMARERAALVPIGYADGLRRQLSNRGQMAIGGQRVPILGRVCMDQTVVGLANDGRTDSGDHVNVVGTGEAGEPTFTEVARDMGTIPYELVTGLAARVPRYYRRAGKIVACRDLQGLHRIER